MTPTRTVHPTVVAGLAGLVASGIGLAGWSVGREWLGTVATLAGSVLAGVPVGRSRSLLAAWVVATAPLVLIAVFVLPDPKYLYREIVQLFAASIGVGQGVCVALGSAIGVAVFRRRLGPLRSAQALALLALAAGGAAIGWLWFAANVASAG